MKYEYWQTKDEFQKKIENNYFNDNDRNNIKRFFKIQLKNIVELLKQMKEKYEEK